MCQIFLSNLRNILYYIYRTLQNVLRYFYQIYGIYQHGLHTLRIINIFQSPKSLGSHLRYEIADSPCILMKSMEPHVAKWSIWRKRLSWNGPWCSHTQVFLAISTLRLWLLAPTKRTYFASLSQFQKFLWDYVMSSWAALTDQQAFIGSRTRPLIRQSLVYSPKPKRWRCTGFANAHVFAAV